MIKRKYRMITRESVRKKKVEREWGLCVRERDEERESERERKRERK